MARTLQLSRHSNKNMNSGGGGYEECSPFLLIENQMALIDI